MKKTLKYLSLVLAALFIIAGSTLVAFADDPPAGDPPVTPDPVVDPEPVVDPQPVIEPDPYIEPDPGSYTPDDGGSGNTGTGTGDGDNYTGNYTTTDDYYRNTDDPLVYSFGDDANVNRPSASDEAAGSVTSKTKLYDSNGISDKDAAPNKWSEITLDEKKTTTTGVTDFSSIKNDTNRNARHYDWLIYVGYALIGLSVLGIIYFIIATAVQRKADRELEAREPRTETRRTSRFADEDTYRPRKVSAKADTDEVYVPRRARHAK